MVELAGEEEQELAAEMAAQFLHENLPEEKFGVPRAGASMWASVVRLVSPLDGNTLQEFPLAQNEAAFWSVLRRDHRRRPIFALLF